jgi:threonyl-tRNA synthetase
MAVLGEKEIESGGVAVRNRLDGELGALTLDELVDKMQNEVTNKRG